MIGVEVTDRAALAARSPSDLAMYLRSRNWTIRAETESAIYWIKDVEGEQYEALQPLESGVRDYGARVRDVLHVLAIAEGRSQLDVLDDISNVSMDVHLVRTFPADSSPGMIGLDDGVQAFESLRSLFVAAAYAESSDEPRAVQPSRKPAEVLRFLRDVRIGPNKEGSFIFSVHTPIPPRLTSGQVSLFEGGDVTPLEPAEPFERRVSLRVYYAAQAAHEAATSALVKPDGLDAFTRAVRRGVSGSSHLTGLVLS